MSHIDDATHGRLLPLTEEMDMTRNCYDVDCTGWELLHPRATVDHLGYVPDFISAHIMMPISEQINGSYASGWHSFKGFTFNFRSNTLKCPGDPPLHPIASYAHPLTGEVAYLYDSAWVCIVNRDCTSYDVARID